MISYKLLILHVFLLNLTYIPKNGHAIESESQQFFEEVYRRGIWGKDATGYGTSGGGSTLPQGLPFITYLQDFLNTHSIQTIVDVGCGDWVLAKEIDWGECEYLGIDVVKPLIERNQGAYASENIHFLHMDASLESIPKGDLLICKDVLQHLSYKCINHIISESMKFKYCIFVNDIDPANSFTINTDILIDGYHQIDLTSHPFNIKSEELSSYISGPNRKQILLIKNEN